MSTIWEFMSRISDDTARMQRLINDLLTYSRVGREIQLQPTDCQHLVSQEIANLSAAIKESGARVLCDELPTVLADPTLLAQVFRNLIGNAVKFKGEDTPEAHVTVMQSAADWVFAVKDNGIGIGIDPEFQVRVFTIFERLHSTEEYSGTGMGLSICKKAVESWNGRICVESRPGQGTAFFFTIPSSPDAAGTSPGVTDATEEHHGRLTLGFVLGTSRARSI